jgi:FkbM family methyltransferase
MSARYRLKRWVRDTYGDHRVRRVKSVRTHLACKLDVGPWRRPGLNGIDVDLAEAFGWERGGTFIELGGNDGLQYSNTLLLERELGWRGVLIEGVPELAAESVRNRPEATVVCAAVTREAAAGVVPMNDEDLISTISDSPGRVYVATTTLSTVIDQVMKGLAPDLLIIDVEGFEFDVLDGLDLSRHRPRWMLVETVEERRVGRILDGYTRIGKLSHHDYLYRLDADHGAGRLRAVESNRELAGSSRAAHAPNG